MAVSISFYNFLFECCSLLVLGQQFWALSVYSLSADKQNMIFNFFFFFVIPKTKDSDSTQLLRLSRPQVVLTWCCVGWWLSPSWP